MTDLERVREALEYSEGQQRHGKTIEMMREALADLDAHLKEDAERFQFAEDQYQRLQAELARLRDEQRREHDLCVQCHLHAPREELVRLQRMVNEDSDENERLNTLLDEKEAELRELEAALEGREDMIDERDKRIQTLEAENEVYRNADVALRQMNEAVKADSEEAWDRVRELEEALQDILARCVEVVHQALQGGQVPREDDVDYVKRVYGDLQGGREEEAGEQP